MRIRGTPDDYLDYNATTPLCDAAREAMLPYLNRHFAIHPVSTLLAAKRAPPLTMVATSRRAPQCKTRRNHFYERRNRVMQPGRARPGAVWIFTRRPPH